MANENSDDNLFVLERYINQEIQNIVNKNDVF